MTRPSAEARGHYYGSDAKRSPLDRYRAPGDPEYCPQVDSCTRSVQKSFRGNAVTDRFNFKISQFGLS